jgi:hypothetical protein
MGLRRGVDKQGRVMEDMDGEQDAWLQEQDGPKTAEKDQKKEERKQGALNDAAARLFNGKKDTTMGPPIRRSKEPLTNLEIILSHVKPSETILKALKRLGDIKSAGAAPKTGVKKKNVRTRPSAIGMESTQSAGKGSATVTSASEASAAGRAFEELTEAAQVTPSPLLSHCNRYFVTP